MKKVLVWMMLFAAVAGVTGCTAMKHNVCMANKVGNHR